MNHLRTALSYHGRGWCVIPVKGKLPADGLKWKPYAQRRPTEAELRAWFARNGVTGLAVLLGPVSGGLCCRDFDVLDAYERWATSQPELAANLPTVKSARGCHVYFKSTVALRTKTLEDGELRGEGGYCVLPPSLHPSGHVYQWLVPLPAGDVPTIDLEKSALACAWAGSTTLPKTTNRFCPPLSTLSSQPALSSLLTLPSLSNAQKLTGKETLDAAIAEAMKLALPRGVHQNHKALFTLARALKAIEGTLGRELLERELSATFGKWYQSARLFLRPGQSRDEYWFEFLAGYDNVKYPLGEGVLQAAWEAAQKPPLPGVAMQFEKPEIRLLVALCRELQRASGKGPFYLACRTVERLLHGVPCSTANFWLNGLVRTKIIALVQRGGPETNKASRYRYLHPLND